MSTDEKTTSHASDGGGQGDQGNWRRLVTFAEASAALAVIAGFTYVFGLFALWLTIMLHYTHDFPAAWFAVSLVPNTLVAGLGVRQLIATLLTVGLGIAIPIFWRMFTYWLVKDKSRDEADRTHQHPEFVYWIFLALVLAVSLLGYFGLITVEPNVRRIFVGDFFVFVITLGVTAFLTAFLSQHFGLSFAKGKFLPKVESKRRLSISVLAILVASVLAASYNLVSEQPTLPTVEIRGEHTVKGSLLTHRDRFWYVFTKEGTLVATSEDKVKTVQIAPEGDQ